MNQVETVYTSKVVLHLNGTMDRTVVTYSGVVWWHLSDTFLQLKLENGITQMINASLINTFSIEGE